MRAYEALARVYDVLTSDVGYERRADYLEKLFCTIPPPARIPGTQCVFAGQGHFPGDKSQIPQRRGIVVSVGKKV